MALLLGIDIGTSAAKAVVCDGGGRIVGAGSAEYGLSWPRPGWSEQDPEDWWRGACAAVRTALTAGGVRGAEIGGVGLSGQMHGSVFLSQGTVAGGGREAPALRPALLWNDQRTAPQCGAIEAAVGGRRRLVELVGNAALTGFTLPKILWVREHEPEVFRRTALVLLPKDYVRLRLTGVPATDVGDASGTLLFDVDRRAWSAAAFAAVGLDPSLLPPAAESGEAIGGVTAWAAGETGLRAGIPVVAGSADNMMGAVGAGVIRPGMVLATLGTSGVIYAHSDRARKDVHEAETAGRIHTMCAATGTARDPTGWCLTGCTLSAGGSLKWCRDTLFPGTTYDELMSEAAGVPPGCEGLVFLPYLTGERCPHPDPLARGAWVGLTGRHTRGHLVRAVVEGVTFGMGQILDIMRSLGVVVERVRLGGGGSRSSFWRQVQADVYDCPVSLTNTEEGPAFGAALLAGVGAGVWPNIGAACGATITETETLDPAPETGARYRAVRDVHAALYADLRGHFAALSAADAGPVS